MQNNREGGGNERGSGETKDRLVDGAMIVAIRIQTLPTRPEVSRLLDKQLGLRPADDQSRKIARVGVADLEREQRQTSQQ